MSVHGPCKSLGMEEVEEAGTLKEPATHVADAVALEFIAE